MKSKMEKKMLKEIEQENRRDEALQLFNDQLDGLKQKRQEYARIAAEAELNGDATTYDVAVNSLIELNDVVKSLMQTKASFDLVSISNSIATSMAMAVNALDSMTNEKCNLPNLKKIQRTSAKTKNYLKQISLSQQMMGRIMNVSKPVGRSRSEDELASVRPMIEAERSRISGVSTGQSAQCATIDFDLSKEINAEKNKLI